MTDHPPMPRPLTLVERDALHRKLHSDTAAVQVVEERVSQALLARLNALIHGGTTMLKNDERTRRDIADIVREVIEAEVPRPPFEVEVDMTTNPNRVQINFVYPLGPIL